MYTFNSVLLYRKTGRGKGLGKARDTERRKRLREIEHLTLGKRTSKRMDLGFNKEDIEGEFSNVQGKIRVHRVLGLQGEEVMFLEVVFQGHFMQCLKSGRTCD